MNPLDIVILVLFIPGLIRGLTKGMVEQIVSIAGLVSGAFLAHSYYERGAEMLGSVISADPAVLKVAAFAVIMIITLLAVILLSRVITKIIEMAALGWLNRLVGAALSVMVTAIILGLLAGMFDSVNANLQLVAEDNPVLSGSILYPAVKNFTATILPFLKQFITSI